MTYTKFLTWFDPDLTGFDPQLTPSGPPVTDSDFSFLLRVRPVRVLLGDVCPRSVTRLSSSSKPHPHSDPKSLIFYPTFLLADTSMRRSNSKTTSLSVWGTQCIGDGRDASSRKCRTLPLSTSATSWRYQTSTRRVCILSPSSYL